jgi:CHAD domain-containing protein
MSARPEDGIAAYVRATLDTQVRTLLHQHSDVDDNEKPEAVHQMRVAGRRIRVALRIAGPVLGEEGERVRAEVAWLGGLLGPVRDLDVLCDRLASEAADLPEPDRAGFVQVLSALHAARAARGAQVVTALGGRRYRALLRALANLTRPTADSEPGEPINPAELVRRPVRKIRREVTLLGRNPADADLHELRIHGKRIRYAAEFGAELAGRRAAAKLHTLARAAKQFQDVLGAHQDTVAAEHRLRELADHEPLTPNALLVLGRLIERENLERDRRRAAWWPAWRTLEHAAKPFR